MATRKPGAAIDRGIRAGIICGVLLLHAPIHAQAVDVCALNGAALNREIEKGAAEIAAAYAATTPKSVLSLSGGPCDWTCGRGKPITQVAKAFGFLQYNCNTTAAPSSTRLPTGNQPPTDSEMGLSITDHDYQVATDKIFRSGSASVGDLMRVPPSLELASQTADVKKLIAAVNALPGATWMTFSSTSVNNPPAGGDRIIIRVVDQQNPVRFEQWIQIAINENTGQLDRNVDFVAVQLQPDPASPLPDDRPAVAFRGFSRTPTGFVPEGKGANPKSELSKCYSCHPTGLRAIIPAPGGTRTAVNGQLALKPAGTIPLTGSGNITELTEQMLQGLAHFGPIGYTASENGPPFGPSVRSARPAFVANGCASGLSAPRQAAIVGNMDCQQCHDDMTERRVLNAGTSIETIQHKVVKNTVAPMPPQRLWNAKPSLKLSASERAVLFKCLQAEYTEMLREWLTSDLLMVP